MPKQTISVVKKLDSHLIASSVENIGVKNYLNLIILLQVTIKNVQDVFSRHGVCKFVERFKQSARMRRTDDRHTDHAMEKCAE